MIVIIDVFDEHLHRPFRRSLSHDVLEQKPILSKYISLLMKRLEQEALDGRSFDQRTGVTPLLLMLLAI